MTRGQPRSSSLRSPPHATAALLSPKSVRAAQPLTAILSTQTAGPALEATRESSAASRESVVVAGSRASDLQSGGCHASARNRLETAEQRQRGRALR